MAEAVKLGIPTPCFSTALAFYDGYRSERLPANLIQVTITFTHLEIVVWINDTFENIFGIKNDIVISLQSSC